MLPSALIQQLEQGMADFLRASFWSTTPGFESIVDDFLTTPKQLFQGPYFSLQLPFITGTGAHNFDAVPPEFPPYAHQETAWKRLAASKSTLVATGTGSGKTECFVLPLLAHCAARLGTPGIKAIILYPMNALAADQAKRIAELIYGNDKLRGNVRAGMYVGQREKSPHTSMGEHHLITDRDTIRKNPPDILLTNYKMLDYLLMRPEDQILWTAQDPETLKYLVVDELHTFDGAQGTDLACLIRRLKSRLYTPKEHLTCVGTSATLGGPAAAPALIQYASEVFGESFDVNSVVTEQRKTPEQFWAGELMQTDHPDRWLESKALDPTLYESDDAYLKALKELAFPDKVLDAKALGNRLREDMFFRNLVTLLTGGPTALDELVERLSQGQQDPIMIRRRILAYMALTSAARAADGQPFMQVRVQLWQREMKRMVASVGMNPRLVFHDDLTFEQRRIHLPVIHCRECGLMGWATLIHKDSTRCVSAVQEIYRAYFRNDSSVEFMFPKAANPAWPSWFLNTRSLNRQSIEPEDEPCMEVVFARNKKIRNGSLVLDRDCPQCDGASSLSLVGFQAATLTSTYINQLFASPFNNDRRLLTFSDSVQDAAHRAGFFGARTWKFNLRIALQRVVEELDTDITIPELIPKVISYWHDKLGDEAYVATFIAPSMEWFEDYQALLENNELPEGTKILESINRRLSWEIFNEYGLRSKLGRSLQQAGASAAYIDPEKCHKAVRKIGDRVRDELGGFEKLSDEQAQQIVTLYLDRMRERGAIYQPELPREYLKTAGKNVYIFGKIITHLPNYGPISRLPVFPSAAGIERFEKVYGGTGNPTWFERIVQQFTEHQSVLQSGMAHAVVTIIFEELVAAEVLDPKRAGIPSWGIRPDALFVSRDLVEFEAKDTNNIAGQRRWVARCVAPEFTHLPIGVIGSKLAYTPSKGSDTDYYAKLYRTGEVARINAAEHTGLLKRDDREAIEGRFKSEHPHPWDPNLLSCTPTLEMGIDIGALSSAILCSVPPRVSNFLQRVGRAGRKDGNSLLLTIANGRPHDLYFFSDPLEMIAGDVETPGIYLNAIAVLSRQLTAFCMDRWIQTENITRKQFPYKLGKALAALKTPEQTDKFPHNFIQYVQLHETLLMKGFLDMFDSSIAEDTIAALKEFMRGGSEVGGLALRISEGLHQQRTDRENRNNEVKRLNQRMKKLESKSPLSPLEITELRDIKREFYALRSLVGNMDHKDTLQFFTDEGLLPNYAFPEAGVSLKSIIWKKTKRAGDDNYTNIEYSFERPARSAIFEFAPGSRFYAGGRQVEITQIDVKGSKVVAYRFCPNCTYSEHIDGGDNRKQCPVCKSPHWADKGQRREMLKLRQVFAWTGDQDSLIDDSSEERKGQFFNRQMLVSFAEGTAKHGHSAWFIADSELPFGAEYVSAATFREINFGPRQDIGTKFSIAGVDTVRQGFTVCTDCGMVQPKKTAKHTAFCKWKGKDGHAKFETCLYLFREFQSEAVRLLLPFIDDLGYETKLHSFVAALEMGLRRHFGGRIDHLASTLFSEPVENEVRRKQFLVVYDTVPGGTGYLHELVRDHDTLFGILENSLNQLKSCACNQDLEKDGCYRCLFAFRNATDMDDTSRETAIEVISEILKHRGKTQAIDTLGKVSVGGLIESQLEKRFLEGLRRLAAPMGVEMRPEIVRGKPGFRLVFETHDWLIEPQVSLGSAHGVISPSRADLVIWPAKKSDAVKPIVIFSDGFRFHADRLALDFYQRMALMATGRFRVWNLVWDDMNAAMESSSTQSWYDVMGAASADETAEIAQKLLKDHVEGDAKTLRKAGSLELLMHILATNSEADIKALACVNASAAIFSQEVYPHEARADWNRDLAEHVDEHVAMAMSENLPEGYSVGGNQRALPGFLHRVFVCADQKALHTMDPDGMRALLWLEDDPIQRDRPEFPGLWNGTLRALNILQFLRRVFVLSAMDQEDFNYVELLDEMVLPSSADDTVNSMSWKEAISLAAELEDRYGKALQLLSQLHLPAPIAGFELFDGGRLVAQAEAGWPKAKLALITAEVDDEVAFKDYCQEFGKRGWTVIDIDHTAERLQDIAKILDAVS